MLLTLFTFVAANATSFDADNDLFLVESIGEGKVDSDHADEGDSQVSETNVSFVIPPFTMN